METGKLTNFNINMAFSRNYFKSLQIISDNLESHLGKFENLNLLGVWGHSWAKQGNLLQNSTQNK